MEIKPIYQIEDWEQRIKRQDAFWECEIIDRPVVSIIIEEPSIKAKLPKSFHKTLRDRWCDPEFQAQTAVEQVKKTQYLGDALPVKFPDLGPDFFASCFNLQSEIKFVEDTSHLKPFVDDFSTLEKIIQFSESNPWYKIMEDLYSAFFELGNGLFYTGLPDIHPGADCMVGFRGPDKFSMDLYDYPSEIQRSITYITDSFLDLFEKYYQKIKAEREPCTGWAQIVSTKRWHVPSCDFSFMISSKMFEQFFLEGIIREINNFEASIFHVDGPGVLRHLDLLLEIKQLSAIQWIYGAGNGRASDWIEVYKKVQSAGKALQLIDVEPDEIPMLIDNLKPEGLWLMMKNVPDKAASGQILSSVSHWKK